jgi:hypothetical protein
MKGKSVLLTAVVCLMGASASYGQLGFSPIKRPNIANIFRPEVGQGAVYEQTDSEGKKSRMEMSVVGKEMVGTEEGFWMEVGHNEGKDGNLKYGKVLVTKDFTFHKMVFVMPGSPQPMEMDMNNAKGPPRRHGKGSGEVTFGWNGNDHGSRWNVFLRALAEGRRQRRRLGES